MKISKELLKGSTGTMILQLLSEQDMYGYMIIQQIEVRSDSVFRMSEGSLYPILHAMEKDGLLEAYRQVSESGKERKYYRITPKGRLQLSLKLDEWKLFSSSVSKILGNE
ncbi:MAG: PadR family transcriptional regulator [Ruminococcaceae bacterium]|nr:PadR family transcriptional regulator [Oscillospiraceae bacterium]